MDVFFEFLKSLEPTNMKADNWKHRSKGMLCSTCMYFVGKKVQEATVSIIGRCRKHAPTMAGWPVMFASDWCGDHKLDENKL